MSFAARIGHAIFWGQAGRLAEVTLGFLFSLVLARVLGPASYGLYALGISIAGLCGFLALLGLGPETFGRFLPEVVARGGREKVRGLLGKVAAIRAAAILLLAGTILVFRREVSEKLHFPLILAPLLLVLLVFAVRSIFDLLTHFTSGLLDLRRVAAAKLTASLTAPCLFLMFAATRHASVNSAWLATLGSGLGGILVLAIPFGTARSQANMEGMPALSRVLIFGMFAWATNFFVYILGDNMDVLLLSWLLPDRAAVGQYALGAKIVFSMTGLLLGWVSLVTMATLSEAMRRGGVEVLARVAQAQWKFGVLCMAGPVLFLLRHASEIVAVIYSAAYEPSVPVIQILAGLTACGVICGFSLPAGILYALDQERKACAAVGASAVFNVASEIFLVRRFGISGAALSTGLSMVLLAALCATTARYYVPLRFPWLFIGKVFSAGFAGVVSTWWLHPASMQALLEVGALYGSVFFLSLLILKPLDEDDSASLYRLNGFLGGWAERLFADMSVTVKEG